MQVLVRDKNDIHARWDRAMMYCNLKELKKVQFSARKPFYLPIILHPVLLHRK